MKRIALLAVLVLVVVGAAQAQTWQNFWHPRPKAPVVMGVAVTTTPILEFKPEFMVSATQFYKGADGSFQSSFLSAAGPALLLQSSHQLPDGTNYADYSGSLALLLRGSSQSSPTFQPAAALMIGFLNNLVQVGGGYTLVAPVGGEGRAFGLLAIGINLTQN